MSGSHKLCWLYGLCLVISQPASSSLDRFEACIRRGHQEAFEQESDVLPVFNRSNRTLTPQLICVGK